MGHQERVKITELCKVEPIDTATITTPKKLPLTFFDLLWLRSPPVKRVFFFNTWSSDVIPRLKHSLPLALRHFLPLAGNLIWPESSTTPFVRYLEGDGILFCVAEPGPDLDFHVLSGADVAFEAEAYHALVPDLAVSGEKAALVAVQVTMFSGNGFSIGVTLHHAVLDGRSVHMFVKSWAHICRSLKSEEFSACLPEDLTPFYDRTAIQDLGCIGEIYARNWMSFDGPENRSLIPTEHNPSPGLVRGSFTLTHRDIEKIRLIVAPRISRTSTFSLVCAYVWLCLVKAEEKHTEDFTAMIGILCDCRSRLNPPLPVNYFGNCVAGGMAVAGGKDFALDLSEGLCSAMKSLADLIKSFEDDRLLKGAEDWVLRMGSFSVPTAGVSFCSVAGSPRFEAYGADFGWGRPAKTDVVSIDSSRAILIQDARDGDGIEFGLALKKPTMQAFASLLRQGLS